MLITSFFAYSSCLVARSDDLPAAPDTGTPEDNSSPGGTRIDKDSTCQRKQKTLTSLLGIGDFTLSKYPTFWFYIPYTPQEIGYLEFNLKGTARSKPIYRTSIELKDRPGIINITIPQQERRENYIYYDAVKTLADWYFVNPNDERLTKDWHQLLELLGKKELVNEPLVEALLLPPQD